MTLTFDTLTFKFYCMRHVIIFSRVSSQILVFFSYQGFNSAILATAVLLCYVTARNK